jgi:hypothetical protein
MVSGIWPTWRTSGIPQARRLSSIGLTLVALATIACQASAPTVSLPPHRVLAEKTTDMALKTQVEQTLLLMGEPTTLGLRSLLEAQYGRITARRGYKYHEMPTNVYLYVYDDEEQATSGRSLWRAMLRKDYGTEPAILLREHGLVRNVTAPNDAAESERTRQGSSPTQ